MNQAKLASPRSGDESIRSYAKRFIPNEIDRLRAALVDQQRQREELELELEQAVVPSANAKEGIRIDELVADPCAVHAEDRT